MSDQPMNENQRSELERLIAERDAHRAHRGRRGARWVLSATLMILAAVIALLSVVIVYARDELLDTDRYVETVAPLAEDPDVQAAVATRITDTINAKLDLPTLTAEALDAIETRGAPEALSLLAEPIATSVEGFIADQVDAVVRSDQFAELWTGVNETAHRGIGAILRGEDSELLSVQEGVLYIDIGPVVEEVKARLVDRGLTLAERIPEVSVQFPLMEVRGLENARGVASLIETLAWTLPLAALVLLAVGVYASPNRRRAWLAGALMFAAAMVLLLAGIAVARTAMLANLPEEVQSPQAAAAVFDIVVRFMVAGAQTFLVAALIVAVAAWFLGPGVVARTLRRGLSRLRDLIASGLTRSGLPVSVAQFAAANRRALEIAAVVLGLIWLLLWSHRGVGGTLWVTAVVAFAVAVVEVLASARATRDQARPVAGRSGPSPAGESRSSGA